MMEKERAAYQKAADYLVVVRKSLFDAEQEMKLRLGKFQEACKHENIQRQTYKGWPPGDDDPVYCTECQKYLGKAYTVFKNRT